MRCYHLNDLTGAEEQLREAESICEQEGRMMPGALDVHNLLGALTLDKGVLRTL